jgi:serine/threonine protein kinase/formylglycine-generating enzyme required for sulfatase activity
MGLSENDQKLIKHLLGRQLIGAEAVVQLTLQASESQTSILQVILDGRHVAPTHLTDFLSPELQSYPETVQSLNEDDSETVISSESERLAGRLTSPEAIPAPRTGGEPIPAPSSSLPRPNSRFGPFFLHDMIGQGGMGMVFRARQIDLDRECAVKILVGGDTANDGSLLRFIAEAKTFAQLDQHPYIVRVIDAGQVGHHYYISMELVNGRSLKEAVVKKKLDVRTIIQHVAQIADALAAVHSRGIIHRDIKPGNILISPETAKLTDFGIAKNTPKDNDLTTTGSVIGTLAYMPPEQAEDSKSIDLRADIYSLGAVLYYALTGRAPHVGASNANVIASLLMREPERPRALNPKISPALEKIILKAMSREPENRYQTAESLRDILLLYLKNADKNGLAAEGGPKKPPRRPKKQARKNSALPLNVAILALVALTITAFVLVKNQRSSTPAERSAVGQNKTKDTTPARVTRLNIKEDQWITKSQVEISGQLDRPATRLTLTIDGRTQKAEVDDMNVFVASFKLTDGAKELRISQGSDSKAATIAIVPFHVDTAKPVIELEQTVKKTEQKTLVIQGQVRDSNLVKVTLNDKHVTVTDARFRETVALKMGANPIVIEAIDKAGLRTTHKLSVERRPLEPGLTLKGCPALTRQKSWTFQGTVTPDGAELTLNGKAVNVNKGAFNTTLDLREGANKFVFLVRYKSQLHKKELTIKSDVSIPRLSVERPGPKTKEPKIQFLLNSNEDSKFELKVGAKTYSSQAQAFVLSFEKELMLAEAIHLYTVTVTDRAGNKCVHSGRVLVDRSGPAIDFDVDWKKSTKSSLTLKGSIKDASKIEKFTLGKRRLTIKSGGQFSVRVQRKKLSSGLLFKAVDELGNRSELPIKLDLVLLSDWKKWQSAGQSREGLRAQDAEIQLVAKRLGRAFKYSGVKTYSCAGKSFRIATFVHSKTAIQFNLIPGGQFLMGVKVSPADVIGASPQCSVRIKPFLMGRFEVLQKEWRVYDRLLAPGKVGAGLPMARMSWLAIEKWLKKAGNGLRLPSESEWEYACRAGSTTDYFWGDAFDQSYVWSLNNAGNRVQSGLKHEAAKKWNAFGLLDMLGNVWEWVADSASPGYDEIPPPRDGRPYRQSNVRAYMNRGGYWESTGDELKQWFRDSSVEDKVTNQLGARFAVSIPDK